MKQQLISIVTNTLRALNLELVEIRKNSDVIRIFIDRCDFSSVTLHDCEKSTRQLQSVFAVENINYKQLEVSSPGLNRVLNKCSDLTRFVGNKVLVLLKKPLKSQKYFTGLLLPSNDKNLVAIKLKYKNNCNIMYFNFIDIHQIRLVPQLDFRSLKS